MENEDGGERLDVVLDVDDDVDDSESEEDERGGISALMRRRGDEGLSSFGSPAIFFRAKGWTFNDGKRPLKINEAICSRN